MVTKQYIIDSLTTGAIIFNPKTRAVVYVESWLAEVYKTYRSRSLPRSKPVAICSHETYVKFIGVLKSHGLLIHRTLEVDGNFNTVQELYNFWHKDLKKKQEQYIYRLFNTNENILVCPKAPEITRDVLDAGKHFVRTPKKSPLIRFFIFIRLIFLRSVAHGKKLSWPAFFVDKKRLQV